nr:hypothetical protein [Corynebacterium lactis]
MAGALLRAASSGLRGPAEESEQGARLPAHWLKPVRSFVIYFLLAHVIFGIIWIVDVAALLAKFFSLGETGTEEFFQSAETEQQFAQQLNSSSHGWSDLLISYSEMLGIFSIIAAIVVALTVSASSKIKDLDKELNGVETDEEVDRIVEDRSVDIDMLYGGLLTATMVSLVVTVLYGYGVIVAAEGNCTPEQNSCSFAGSLPWELFARHWMDLASPKMLIFPLMSFFFLILALSASDQGRIRGRILRRIDLSRRLQKHERTLAMFGALHTDGAGSEFVLPTVPWSRRALSGVAYLVVTWLGLVVFLAIFNIVPRLADGESIGTIAGSWTESQLLLGVSLLSVVSAVSVLAVILAVGLTRLRLVNDVYYIIVTVIVAAVPVGMLVAAISRYPARLVGIMLLYLAALLFVTNLLWGFAVFTVRKDVDDAGAVSDSEGTSAAPGLSFAVADFLSTFLRGILVHRVRRVQLKHMELKLELEELNS